MNGNCVLIPAEVATAIGNLDPSFEHAMGDFDYGLRARARGFPIWIAPGFFGTCQRGPNNKELDFGVGREFNSILSRKNLPLRAWAVYARRHAGLFWPAYWAWPYIKALLSSIAYAAQIKECYLSRMEAPIAMKERIREYIPPILWRLLSRRHRSSKQYPTYQAAQNAGTQNGYQYDELVDLIVDKTGRYSLDLEKRAEFDHLALGTLSGFAGIRRCNALNIVDVGGGAGYHYRVAIKAVGKKAVQRWHVVETTAMASRARQLEDGILRFFDNLKAAVQELPHIDLVFSSGTLHCTPDPLGGIRSITELGANAIYITRTALNEGNDTLIIRQRSLFSDNGPGQMPPGYRNQIVSYPNVFVSREKFENILCEKYSIRFKVKENRDEFFVGHHKMPTYSYFCDLK
jgi:putative methyltransferase (TIGR04325 family)